MRHVRIIDHVEPKPGKEAQRALAYKHWQSYGWLIDKTPCCQDRKRRRRTLARDRAWQRVLKFSRPVIFEEYAGRTTRIIK